VADKLDIHFDFFLFALKTKNGLINLSRNLIWDSKTSLTPNGKQMENRQNGNFFNEVLEKKNKEHIKVYTDGSKEDKKVASSGKSEKGCRCKTLFTALNKRQYNYNQSNTIHKNYSKNEHSLAIY
jgi:hypothetical protein